MTEKCPQGLDFMCIYRQEKVLSRKESGLGEKKGPPLCPVFVAPRTVEFWLIGDIFQNFH